MKKRAFTLIELLIIITIIAILVGVALPYYQDYVKQAKLTKAEHELDIIKEALIKYDTMEETPFQHDELRYLIGNYLQDLPRDPWGRDYHINYVEGRIWSDGPDFTDAYDDIKTEYKPALTLQKATWVDYDNNNAISQYDKLKLDFSRCLYAPGAENIADKNSSTSVSLNFGLLDNNASDTLGDYDLVFSNDVDLSSLDTTAVIPASASYMLIGFRNPTNQKAFFPGSSTIQIGLGNEHITDWIKLPDGNYRRAKGTRNYDPADPVKIKGR